MAFLPGYPSSDNRQAWERIAAPEMESAAPEFASSIRNWREYVTRQFGTSIRRYRRCPRSCVVGGVCVSGIAGGVRVAGVARADLDRSADGTAGRLAWTACRTTRHPACVVTDIATHKVALGSKGTGCPVPRLVIVFPDQSRQVVIASSASSRASRANRSALPDRPIALNRSPNRTE
jgi:hypothetical protein